MIATSNCPEDQVEERHYIEGSGIRIGPTQKTFVEVNPNKDYEDLVRGTYRIETGEPIQQIDEEYGIPKLNRNGTPRFETRPSRSCDIHEDDSRSGTLRRIFDIFRGDDEE